tara:strand:- start:1489 stop:1992 length:504 start_codon:yes stop_codon:yes gene_type:complete
MSYLVFVQVVLAFVVGMGSLYVIYRFTDLILKRQYGIKEINNSLSVFQTGIIISTAFLLSSVIAPASNALRFLTQDDLSSMTILLSIAYVVGFVVVGLVSSALVIWGGVTIFFQLTAVNEIEELKKDNIATSLITSAMILGLAIIMSDYVGHLCEALIPYPDINFIR